MGEMGRMGVDGMDGEEYDGSGSGLFLLINWRAASLFMQKTG